MKKVRKDIAAPESAMKRGPKPKNPFDSLPVGGSFVVEDERVLSVRVSVCRKNKEGDRKFQVGPHTDKRGVEQWRCWRIE